MRGKCEACEKAKASYESQDGMKLCSSCYASNPHSEECTCPPCRKIKELEERIDTLKNTIKRMKGKP